MSDKVRYARVTGTDIKEMRKSLPDELYRVGDCILVWVNEGDIYQRGQLIKKPQDDSE